MEQKGQNGQEQILVGIDVGSTTTKVAVMEAATGKVLFSDYTRHHSDQLQSVSRAVKLVKETLAGRSFLTAMTGSGAKHLSEELEIPYVQEVVANSIALKAMYGEIGTAIELGGQDAKIIFFQRDKRTGELQVAAVLAVQVRLWMRLLLFLKHRLRNLTRWRHREQPYMIYPDGAACTPRPTSSLF